jgi:hypothetical protein
MYDPNLGNYLPESPNIDYQIAKSISDTALTLADEPEQTNLAVTIFISGYPQWQRDMLTSAIFTQLFIKPNPQLFIGGSLEVKYTNDRVYYREPGTNDPTIDRAPGIIL